MQRRITIEHYQGPSALAKDLLNFDSVSYGLQILGSATLTMILPLALSSYSYSILLVFET